MTLHDALHPELHPGWLDRKQYISFITSEWSLLLQFQYFRLLYYSHTHTAGAILEKNNVSQISTYDSPSADATGSSSSNAVALQVAGDRVHLDLWDQYGV